MTCHRLLLAQVDELQINAEIASLQRLDNSLQVILLRTGNTNLIVLNLCSNLQLGCFDSCNDLFAVLLGNALLDFQRLAYSALRSRFNLARNQAAQRNTAFSHFLAQHI